MAERRMFSKTIVDSDAFLDMPQSTQVLYFHLSMRADDDGFINNPKKIQRMVGASDDDLKLLIAKNFIIPFESGVVVIKHWRLHNYIRSDRYKPTVYQAELASVKVEENGSYALENEVGIPSGRQLVYQMDTQVRLGKDRLELGKDSIGKYHHGHLCACAREKIENCFQSIFSKTPTEYEIDFVCDSFAALHHDELKPHSFDESDSELIEIAFKAAAESGNMNVAYIDGIFKNWRRGGIRTIDDYWSNEADRDIKAGKIPG